MQYNHILESVDNLPIKQQIRLVEIIRQRIINRKRDTILMNSEAALKEFTAGELKVESASEFIQRLSDSTL